MKPITNRIIVIRNNNLKTVRGCSTKFNKTLQGAIEGALSIIEIKQIMKSLKIQISIEYTKGHTKVTNFKDNPLLFLIN